MDVFTLLDLIDVEFATAPIYIFFNFAAFSYSVCSFIFLVMVGVGRIACAMIVTILSTVAMTMQVKPV